jgi:hypothetical protein
MTNNAAAADPGTSLAKGPASIVGMILLAFGVTALIFGGHSFTTHAVSGTVNGKSWLGVEVNAWSSLLFVGAGALLLFGAPLHWGAKLMSLIVGLGLGAASVIAMSDKHDVFGIFAANGRTELVWGVAAAVLLILALLPRVGGGADETHRDAELRVPRNETGAVNGGRPAPVRRDLPREDVPTSEAERPGARRLR